MTLLTSASAAAVLSCSACRRSAPSAWLTGGRLPETSCCKCGASALLAGRATGGAWKTLPATALLAAAGAKCCASPDVPANLRPFLAWC